MAEYIESLQRLVEQFGRLEGVGKKTAISMAFSILELEDEEAEAFAAEHAAEIQNSVRGSYLLRQILILGILIAAVFLNFANVVAAVVPLVLFRPILMAREAFRKKKA